MMEISGYFSTLYFFVGKRCLQKFQWMQIANMFGCQKEKCFFSSHSHFENSIVL